MKIEAMRKSMLNRGKQVAAGLVTKYWPTLCFYLAKPQARKNLRARRQGDALEIIDDKGKRIIRISAANAVYLPEMVECFEYYFGSAAPVAVRRRNDTYGLIDFSSPRSHNIVGFEDFPVMCPSTAEPFSTTRQYLDFAQLQPGGNVIDVGAYSGLTAIAFSKEVGASGRVLAVEPDPTNFRAAEQNLETHRRVNGLDNVKLVPFAAAGSDGIVELSAEGTMGSSLVSIVGGYRGEKVKVEGRTLMSLARDHGLDRVDFVKMDIEGAERFVIPASSEFLREFRPRLLIEGHPVNGSSTVEPLVAFFESVGYRTSVEPQGGVPLSLIQAWPD